MSARPPQIAYAARVGFGIERRARSRRAKSGLRALLGGKAPGAREAGERLGWLARRMFKSAVVDAGPKRVTLAMEPAGSPVRIAVLPDGELEVQAETAAIGAGYHADVLARLAPLLDELEYVWVDAGGDPRADMMAWLARELAAGAVRVGMSGSRTFRVDAPVLTGMGPRDAAWRDAAIAEPARGVDAFAWWETGAGQRERARALLAMWHEVPWRAPIDDAERALAERVDADLAAAHAADERLALPWSAWSELLGYLDRDDAHAERVRARAAAARPARPIGYRRYPLEIELSGGWSVELGGAFAGRWDDDRARWWATDGDRSVEFTSLTADAETDPDRLLAVAPEAHPVIARSSDGAYRGRVEAAAGTIHGLMVCAPHVAILTCTGDEAWALATWRSLRNTAESE